MGKLKQGSLRWNVVNAIGEGVVLQQDVLNTCSFGDQKLRANYRDVMRHMVEENIIFRIDSLSSNKKMVQFTLTSYGRSRFYKQLSIINAV
jgi:hypothetical protein